MVKDVGLAEELAQDAVVTALERWPESGVPDNPGAWLMATAKRRAIDELRRGKLHLRKQDSLGYELDVRKVSVTDLEAAIDDDIGDDLLRLVFTACHPVLSTEARVALTLRLLGGLTTDEIARAFLVPEPTVAQRIVRAKRTLTEQQIPFEVPRGTELAERLASVLEVIYLVFNEGYSATAGDDWMRPALCEDALRLGRVLCRTGTRRAGGPRPGGADGNPGVALGGAHRCGRSTDSAARAEPRALGSAADPPRPFGAGTSRRARRGGRTLRAASRDRGLPRAGKDRCRNRLGADRGPLRGRSLDACRRRSSN